MEDMEVTNPHFEHEHDDDTVSVASGASADKQEKFDWQLFNSWNTNCDWLRLLRAL